VLVAGLAVAIVVAAATVAAVARGVVMGITDVVVVRGAASDVSMPPVAAERFDVVGVTGAGAVVDGAAAITCVSDCRAVELAS
jgi:hypothetical protein